MNCYTLVRISGCCGDMVVLGVFETMQAASYRLNHLATYADVGDEYRLELFQIATESSEKERWGSKVDKSTTDTTES